MIVLADADLARAAHAAVWSGFARSGQVCIRTERVLVEEKVAAHFVALCGRGGRSPASGARRGQQPGNDDRRDIGAITFAAQMERAERQIADALAPGGPGGGRRRAREDLAPGRFFAPTLIADATAEMAVMREETFGPVLPIMRVRDAEDALRIANDSPTGLSGSVWSGDPAAPAKSPGGCKRAVSA